MDPITSLDALHAHYGTPAEAALRKVVPYLIPSYRAVLERSRFCILTTVGPEGTDGSPRGDDGPVVTVLDDRTLALPDWKGNERIDSLRNIVRDGRISLCFLIPGWKNLLRVNGTAILTADPDLRARFDRGGVQPRTVIVITIAEVYSQCARAVVRAGLWTAGDQSLGLPSIGRMMDEASQGQIDGTTYDAARANRAMTDIW
ncbi:MSMEG_1061 family FMN-dependent PPOX-type flavoprotein [Tabrizicola sp. M-4]|uniref:MSMEG_1061 family FMN-dependent PPOX-type flavoprotein n=1 Tax=Tabrizicola sp. M-4 TaxID=3055847 RepID=UPI003DA9230B